jgi:hypothetical protein
MGLGCMFHPTSHDAQIPKVMSSRLTQAMVTMRFHGVPSAHTQNRAARTLVQTPGFFGPAATNFGYPDNRNRGSRQTLSMLF